MRAAPAFAEGLSNVPVRRPAQDPARVGSLFQSVGVTHPGGNPAGTYFELTRCAGERPATRNAVFLPASETSATMGGLSWLGSFARDDCLRDSLRPQSRDRVISCFTAKWPVGVNRQG